MAVSKAVRRLIRVLDLEEELRRRELELAQAELAQLDAALRAAGEREREGRLLLTSGLLSEDVRDRLAGQHEIHAGSRRGAVLRQHIQRSSLIAEEMRTSFLEKRVERKQAETVVKAAEARESIEEDRRAQQALDTWYLMRPQDDRSDAKRDVGESADKAAQGKEGTAET